MLCLDSIDASYAGSRVLRSVTLTVPANQAVALVGANGAGKTTVLRVASGLLRPTAGSITVDGRDVTGARPSALARLGLCHVPEGRGIFASLTVRENLGLQVDRRSGAAIDRAVAAFPILGNRLRQQAGTLSGGEQQMLALARAYMTSPRLLLLDEVSMGLAPKVVDEIFEFLGTLRAEGVGMLIVEQYLARALELADVVYLLNRGEVAFSGPPSEVKDEDVFTSYLGAGA